MSNSRRFDPEFSDRDAPRRDPSRDREGWQAKRREDRRAKDKVRSVEGAAIVKGWR